MGIQCNEQHPDIDRIGRHKYRQQMTLPEDMAEIKSNQIRQIQDYAQHDSPLNTSPRMVIRDANAAVNRNMGQKMRKHRHLRINRHLFGQSGIE